MNKSKAFILIRGGGDLASGVALRLHRIGLNILITEQPQPLAVRRLVSFAEAVYRGKITVENITAYRVRDAAEAVEIFARQAIPVLIDPNLEVISAPDFALREPLVIIDARMTKLPPAAHKNTAALVIGLGPGFIAGENCHAAIETNRGHYLGRVFWQGATEADTGIPGAVANQVAERVLRAPKSGVFRTRVEIGSRVERGRVIAEIEGKTITAPFSGILRGLLHDGLTVETGTKIGDLDPRGDPQFARLVSEKSLAIGGAVLEAILTRPEIRTQLWI